MYVELTDPDACIVHEKSGNVKENITATNMLRLCLFLLPLTIKVLTSHTILDSAECHKYRNYLGIYFLTAPV